MRPLLFALGLLISPHAAQAEPCRLPDATGADLRAVLGCLQGEINALRREQTRLNRLIAEQALALNELPGAYRNENGRVAITENRSIASAFFSLTSSQTGAVTSLPLDQAVLEQLCSGESGCTIALFLRPDAPRRSDAAPAAPTALTGPCLFGYAPATGAWLRSQACGTARLPQGTDGNGTPGGASGSEVVAEAGGACFLADSDPGLRLGPGAELLGRDQGKGFFLIAAPGLRTGGEGRFNCALAIE